MSRCKAARGGVAKCGSGGGRNASRTVAATRPLVFGDVAEQQAAARTTSCYGSQRDRRRNDSGLRAVARHCFARRAARRLSTNSAYGYLPGSTSTRSRRRLSPVGLLWTKANREYSKSTCASRRQAPLSSVSLRSIIRSHYRTGRCRGWSLWTLQTM